MDIKVVVHTLVSRFLLALVIAVCFVPLLIFFFCVPTDRRYDSRIYFWFMDLFYRASLKISLLPITYKGLENIPDEPAIIIANHQSSLDIPLVGTLLHKFPHVWLAKKELLESLLLRYILPRAAIIIDMSSPLKGMKSLIHALTMIKNKRRHAIIFPEGTRYADGSIHNFFGGFALLAKKTGRCVVPMRIFGANKAYPVGVFWLYRCPVTVVIGKPLCPGPDEHEKDFADRVYRWFLEQEEPHA